MSNNLPIEVAIAILPHEGKFLMQLRDNIPTILYPGLWGLFGGHIEPDETPEIAVEREILEEIGYQIAEPKKFGCYSDDRIIRHVFYAPLTVEIDKLVLSEGWDLGLIGPVQIEAGFAYSAIAGEERPLGAVHQQIMMDFIEWWA
ncbi:NUDIX hydrolase [Chamaesiphon minutus]|uniref:ADP-ribose pyrophosphatase n=1 Tax=Chamaesiphon minutus (strain ATCC 27169 / PCC 6605) TaxID=1173020 RepID=K9UFQ0_CHAP6|nr:NUDIX hydrolase [Chamaesiphon minutus]AFY93932.1 ADP-ribose pyrophosphatase [Chamaesiphon minutus PCC 6605]